ncbi:MAG: hypothetical protein JO316_21940 [Abitibacteriaceae bacterium]|nr:hypothetical protein [Abditibacteriaceae bacterium]
MKAHSKNSLLTCLLCFVLAAPQARADLNYTVSWVGNTFPGAQKWVQQDIHAMWVTPDGTIYTNTGWDEGGREVGAYKNGDVIGKAGHTHGWGYGGGSAIAANSKYIFIAQVMGNEGGGLKDENTWPPKDTKWLGLSRRLKTDITQAATFPGGKGGQGDTLKESFLVVAEVPEKSKFDITGLWADEQRVYVADPFHKQVEVYDAATMQPVTSWPLEQVGPMLMDKAGTFWILQAGEAVTPRVVRYNSDGKMLPQQITFAPGVVPSAICLDNQGRLLVADDGPNQQILIYANVERQPRQIGTFGVKGGIYSGVPGQVGSLRFNHITALGCDGAGNLYIANDGQSGGGGTVLESYRPNGSLNWRLHGLEFVDMADVDPAADTEMSTKEEHFHLDYSRPRGQEWTYAGYTINRFKYPQDPRLHIWSAGTWVRTIQGRRFLFVNDMNGEYLQVYRFNPAQDGETAIPAVMFAKRHVQVEGDWPPHQPQKGEWIWRDANGNGAFDENEYLSNDGKDTSEAQGWWVDDAGNVWLATENAGVRQFPLQGLDRVGNPIWDFARMRVFPKPAEFDQVKRLRYDAAHDVMYLGGTKGEQKNQHWKPMGPVICRYDHWSQGQPTLSWQIVVPYEQGSHGHESCEPMGFDLAGNYLFVPYTGASKAMGIPTGHVKIFNATDGSSVGAMQPPADIGEIGLQDIRECLRAHRRTNGEYVVFLEEDWKSKILLYRLRLPQ